MHISLDLFITKKEKQNPFLVRLRFCIAFLYAKQGAANGWGIFSFRLRATLSFLFFYQSEGTTTSGRKKRRSSTKTNKRERDETGMRQLGKDRGGKLLRDRGINNSRGEEKANNNSNSSNSSTALKKSRNAVPPKSFEQDPLKGVKENEALLREFVDFVASSGDEEEVKKSKKKLINAVFARCNAPYEHVREALKEFSGLKINEKLLEEAMKTLEGIYLRSALGEDEKKKEYFDGGENDQVERKA